MLAVVVGCEIRRDFVEIWFRNRLGTAPQFLPYTERGDFDRHVLGIWYALKIVCS